MTTVQKEKIARRKLSLLQLSQELGNVSKACRIMGYGRQQFCEIRRNFQMYGADRTGGSCRRTWTATSCSTTGSDRIAAGIWTAAGPTRSSRPQSRGRSPPQGTEEGGEAEGGLNGRTGGVRCQVNTIIVQLEQR